MIEPSENPSRALTWKPDFWCPLQLFLERLNSVYATLVQLTLLGNISRLVKQSQHLLRLRLGCLYIGVSSWFRWSELKFIKLRLQWARNEETSRSKTMSSCKNLNRFGRSHLHPVGQLTNTRRSDGSLDPDGTVKEVDKIKIRHYRNVYLNHSEPRIQIDMIRTIRVDHTKSFTSGY